MAEVPVVGNETLTRDIAADLADDPVDAEERLPPKAFPGLRPV